MVSVIIAETMMKLNQALRKNTFQSGLYLMVDLPSNSYKRLILVFIPRNTCTWNFQVGKFSWIDRVVGKFSIDRSWNDWLELSEIRYFKLHQIIPTWCGSFQVKLFQLKTKLKHQIPIAIFDSGFPSYSSLSRSNNLHLSAEKFYIL